jgi:hypothetical protein
MMPQPETSVVDLGALEREYGRTTSRRTTILVVVGLLLICPIGLGMLGLIAADPPTNTGDWVAAITMAVTFLAIGALPTAFWLFHRPTRVRLHEHGLVITRRRFHRSVRWDEVHTIRLQLLSLSVNGVPAGTNCKCALHTSTGPPLVLTHWLDGAIELSLRIEHELLTRMLPQARRALSSGGTVDFGGLFSVGAGGLAKRSGDPVPWSEIESVAAGDGFITVRRRGKRWPWIRRSYGDVPNAMVFVSLAQELARGRLTRA